MHRGGLLDEDVLAGLEGTLGQFVVRGHRCRDNDRVDVWVGEELFEVHRDPRLREALRKLLVLRLVDLGDPSQLSQLVEVAREVRAPVADAGLGDFHSFQTLPSTSCPFVALRKSTITLPRFTTWA